MAQNFGSPVTSNTKGIQEALRQALGLAIDVPFADYVNYLGVEWTPLELFSNGERGAWYEANDISTLYQDANGTIPVISYGDPVGRMLDKSGNNVDAIQPISSRRMVYKASPSRIILDKVDDEFVINVPAGGWVGTMVIATSIGTASYGVNIPAGDYMLGGKGYPSDTMIGVLFRHGALTESEKNQVERYFVSNGAVESYINETSFSQTWFNCSSLTSFPLLDTSNGTSFSSTWSRCSSLTSFPLIDTSSGTNFSFAWDGCTSLASFPLLNTFNGTNFSSAWNSCNSLTSFPLLDVSKGTNFSYSWFNCNSLTSFPANAFDNIKGGNLKSSFFYTNLNQESIDGILVSLVTSGIATGTRVFGQSGGSAPSTTGKAAIDTLRSRGWTVTVTGGY